MSSIAGIFLGRKTQLAAYQHVEINELLGQIFDASTQQGAASYGFYHGRIAGGMPGYAMRSPGKFNSKRMTDPWVDASTRCIIAQFSSSPDMPKFPLEADGIALAHVGKITNAKDILGRKHDTMPASFAITRALLGEPWDMPKFAVSRLGGSMAFAAYNVGRSGLILYRDYQPLALYYSFDWDAYVFASRNSYVPKGRLVNLEIEPYSGFEIGSSGENTRFFIDRRSGTLNKGAVIFSGGVDSLLLATLAAQECHELTLLHFDYGHAAQEQERLACETILPELQHMNPKCHFYLQTVPLGFLKDIGGTLLTETDEKIALDPKQPKEWLPARNTLLTAIAASFCDSHDLPYIYLGLTLEDAGAFPDNTTEFVDRFNAVLDCSTTSRPVIKTPLAAMLKKDIIEKTLALDAPVELTWSCQEGGPKHCGRCPPCKSRQSAFAQLGVEDLVEYES